MSQLVPHRPKPYSHRADVVADVLVSVFGRGGITGTGAEVGVFEGETTARLLHAFPTLQLIMVDLWRPSPWASYAASLDSMSAYGPEVFNRAMVLAMSSTDFADDRRLVLRCDQADASKRVREGALQFVFLDGDHSYEGTASQIAAWAPRVGQGGLVMGHDYGYPCQGFGVDRAVEEAAAREGARLHVGAEYVWWYQRTSALT